MIRAREDRWFLRFRRNGDARLVAKVFDRTAPELWKVAAHLSRDRHAAEDAVQSTFLSALESRHDWDGARPLLSWLLGLLANRVREQRRVAMRVPDAERVALPSGERDPAELAQQGEFGRAVHEALQRLAEPYRLALERHLVHGVAARDLALELGVPSGTVRMRLHRGMEQLRQQLPTSLVGGGLAVAELSRQSFAATRQVVVDRALREGAGGPVGTAVGSGHSVLGSLLGVILMKKTMVAMTACLLVALGVWTAWPALGFTGDAQPVTVATVAQVTVRPIAASEMPTPPNEAPERRAAPPSAPSAAPTGKLDLVFRHGGNGKPVAGVSLEVVAGLPGDPTPRDGRLPPGYPVAAGKVDFGRTDAEGRVTFTLPTGTATASSRSVQLAKPLIAQIEAGMVTELIVDLPVRLEADVEVVDAYGMPLASARILGRTFGDVGYVVERELGRTGADGHWREQFLTSGVPIRAVHDGYVASRPVDLHDRAPKVRLQLATGPGTVAGTVFGSDSQPLAGACLAIQPRVAGAAGERPIAVTADAQGHYECAFVPPGAITVYASRRGPTGVPLWTRVDAVVAERANTTVDLRFGTGARVRVTVQGPDNRPLAGQEVQAMYHPEREQWSGFGTYVIQTTDANGQCVFDDLMAGTHAVRGWNAAGEQLTKNLTLTAGQEVSVDWSQGPSTWVEVQVTDEGGAPMVGWVVDLGPGVGTLRSGKTDSNGVVHFANLAVEQWTISVRSALRGVPLLTRKVDAGTRTVVILAKAQLPVSVVRGVLDCAAGVAIDDVRVEIGVDGSEGMSVGANADGSFAIPALPAGVYQFTVKGSGGAILAIPRRIDLAPAATMDLGIIHVQPPSVLRIDLVCRDDGAITSPTLGLRALAFSPVFGSGRQQADARGITLKDLPAGTFDALIWGEDIAPVILPVTIAGGALRLPVQVERCPPTTFRIHGDTGADGLNGTVTILQSGTELLREHTQDATRYTRGFLPGSYRIEFTASDGSGGGADFTVTRSAGASIEMKLAK